MDLSNVVLNIERDATNAMLGDAAALQKLRDELQSLNSKQLKNIAPILDSYFHKSTGPMQGGVSIEKDAAGNISAITFVPNVQDRILRQEHSVKTTLVPDDIRNPADQLFDILDKDKSGIVTLEELGEASLNPKFKGVQAQMIAQFIRATEKDPEHTPIAMFPDGVKRREFERYYGLWKNSLHQLPDQSYNDVLFGRKGISMEAINQGQIGDCGFVACVAAVAVTHPERIRSMIKDNKDGTYTVTIGPNEQITVNSPTDTERAMSNRSNDFGIWPIVLEKAFAKWKQKHDGTPTGSLTDIAEGDEPVEALRFLTGREPNQLDNIGYFKGAETRDFLENAIAKHLPIVACSKPFENEMTWDGFIGNHAYTVIGFDPKGPGGGTVTLRNPWGFGKGSYTGQWQMSLLTFRKNFSEITSVS